jgi:hypothetical protein
VSAHHRARGRWFRSVRGRAGQPEQGRHTPAYVAFHKDAGVGMMPVGAAGRQSLAQLLDAATDRTVVTHA